MKQQLVRGVRKVLPKGAVRKLEENYRKSRIKLVRARYGDPAKSLRVIAITGTNGKTTTLNFVNEILKEAGYKTAMFTTAVIEVAGERKLNELNATVALTAQMQRFFRSAKKAKVDYTLLEVTSHALDQHKLDGVPIVAAVMTNLTQDHLDYHKTMENYAVAKGKLFAMNPKFIVLNRDDEWFDFFNQYQPSDQKITYGRHDTADIRVTRTKLFRKGSEADLLLDHHLKLELATALPGEFNIDNMVAAATTAYILGIDLKDIMEGIANLEGVPGRFEHVPVNTDYDVVVDYAHTPDGLEKFLTAAKAITKNRIILVFGATGDRDKEKRPIMGEIAAKLADRIVLTDEESYNEDPDAIREQVMQGIESAGGSGKTTEVADRYEAIKMGLDIAKKGDTVLITGMGHEKFRIVNGERLPWNDAEAVQEILAEK
jgi:UDP-N-acetylmuramoyl-L-alanyl-D-glutamate--2,6-diaminopimelate ligase